MVGQNWGSDIWRIDFLVKFYNELCLAACLNESYVLTSKYFSPYFQDNLGSHVFDLFTIKIFNLSLKRSLLFSMFNSFNTNIESYQTNHWSNIL